MIEMIVTLCLSPGIAMVPGVHLLRARNRRRLAHQLAIRRAHIRYLESTLLDDLPARPLTVELIGS